ncbi:MAG: hypothetical protein WB660_24570 [Candidatus Sulfotelmatobacter sp.]
MRDGCHEEEKLQAANGQSAKGEVKIENDALTAVKYPDFAARRKKIFGDRVLNADDDFLQYRHREWELAMETHSPLQEKTGPTRSR